MHIGSVRARNFRALEDASVDLAPMTLLIGENSTGKSSLLHALAFFFEGTALSPADVCSRSPGGTVSVEVQLGNLGDADREAFGALADGSTCTLTRTWSEAEGVRMRGVALQFPAFRQVREADSFRARQAAYNSIREGLDLPPVRGQADLDAAMAQYERDHSKKCERSEIDATTIAATALRTRVRFVHVPAVQDASREAHEGKNTLLGRILSALAEQRAGVASEVAAVQEELRRYEQRIGDAHRAGLAQIEKRLSDQLHEVLPDGRIELTPGPVSFEMREPEVRLRGGERDELTEMGLQGHGFQRSFLIATLQLIPRLEASEPGSFRLFLAIEEPELFQHPSRIRYLARVLDEVAVAADRGVQVCVTTHSPYLIDGARYERLRLLRRGAPGGPLRTVASATEDDVARRLGAVPVEVRAKLGRTMDIRFNEAFFARAVILAEGTSDAGALLGTADAMKVDLDREGVMLLSANGKSVIPVRVAILEALGMPVFVLFDADRGNVDAQRHNLEIQRVLGVSVPVAEPSDTRGERFVCFERTIEAHLEALHKGFAKECADRAKAIGFGNKSTEIYRELTAELEPVPLLRYAVERVVALARGKGREGT